jgi:thioredoxin 1
MTRRFLGIAVLLGSLACHAGTLPYDESADARADIRRGLAEARQAHVPLLVVFGANWCGDCRVLDMALKSGPSAPLVAREFRVVKVNVGHFDRNVDVATSYGVPLKKGIPTVAILSPEGHVLHATRAGELADARNMGEQGLYAFFRSLADARR